MRLTELFTCSSPIPLPAASDESASQQPGAQVVTVIPAVLHTMQYVATHGSVDCLHLRHISAAD